MTLVDEYDLLLEKQALLGAALGAAKWGAKKAGGMYLNGIKDFAKNPIKTVGTNLAIGAGISAATAAASKAMTPAAQNTAKRAAPLMNSAANASHQLGQQALAR